MNQLHLYRNEETFVGTQEDIRCYRDEI